MAKPHTIRLRGPWNALAEGAPLGRVKLPTSWDQGLDAGLGAVTLRRRFHRPTVLPEYERVVLCVRSPHGLEAVALNDRPASLADGRCDITERLDEANHLTVHLRRQASAAGDSLLDAWLEIEERRE